MSVATTTAIGIAAGVGAAGAIGGATIAANGASNAANAQVSAANQAANLQHQDAQAALDQQNKQFQTSQANIAPWLGVGRGALANLAYQMGIPLDGMTIPGTAGTPGSTIRVPSGNMMPDDGNGAPLDGALNMDGNGVHSGLAVRGGATFMDQAVPGTPGTPDTPLSSLVNPNLGAAGSLQWKPPTDVTEQNDPGFNFRRDQANLALEHSAAARGGLLSGGTAQDLAKFNQDYASNEYGNVYNRALTDYNTRFNSLANLAGVGQQAATNLGTLGAQNSAQNSTILMNSGQQIGQDLQNAGAARASGYAAGANAYGGALGSIGGNISNLALLSSMGLLGGGGSTAAAMPSVQQSFLIGQGYLG